jgi:hypothetical protein
MSFRVKRRLSFPTHGFAVGAAIAFASVASSQVPLGPEFRVHDAGTAQQRTPDVAADSSGGFVVTWMESSDVGPTQLLGQRFDADGAPLGAQFEITDDNPGTSSVASTGPNGFVVAWSAAVCFSTTAPGCSRGEPARKQLAIRAQRYDEAGDPLGGEFQVNSDSGRHQYPRVSGTENGGFVVAWRDFSHGPKYRVVARPFGANGEPLDTDVEVYSSPEQEWSPSVAADRNGFTVAWIEARADAVDVLQRTFDPNGGSAGPVTPLALNVGWDYGSDITSSSANRRIAVWSESTIRDNSFARARIVGRRITSDAAKAGSPFLVESEKSTLEYPRAAANSRGDLVVVWSDGSTYDVFGRAFDRRGRATGDPFLVSESIEPRGHQGPVVAFQDDRTFIVAWASSNTISTGGTYDVRARRFELAATCFGRRVTVHGTNDDDVLRGTPGDDVIDAEGGNDDIQAGEGNDVICGGPGDDTVRGGRGNDTILGGGGADNLLGASGRDSLIGGAGADVIGGGPEDDLLAGGAGTDHLEGGFGTDTCKAEDGDVVGSCE